jgi:hypothetical protein
MWSYDPGREGILNMRITTTLVATTALFGMLACAHGNKQSNSQSNINNNAPVTIQVTNDNPQDVDVFVSSGEGQRQRLGTVTSAQTQSFTVPASAAHSNGMRLFVHPIGGGGDYSTGALTITPGDQVDLRVAPVVRQTSYMIAQRAS